MKMNHSAAPNPIYELSKTFLVDVELKELTTFTIEIYKNTEDQSKFRARIYEKELFRLTPSFPRDKEQAPKEESDDDLNVERHMPFMGFNYETFTANSLEQAQDIIIKGIRQFVAHSTGKED
jgi:hypothetical protein